MFPIRSQNRRASYADKWWQYAEARPGMRLAMKDKARYIATPAVAKHRVFTWVQTMILCYQGAFVYCRSRRFSLYRTFRNSFVDCNVLAAVSPVLAKSANEVTVLGRKFMA